MFWGRIRYRIHSGMAGRGGIQKVALVLLERTGSSERYSGSVTGDDIVTEKQQEGKYGLGEFWPGFYVLLSNPAQSHD